MKASALPVIANPTFATEDQVQNDKVSVPIAREYWPTEDWRTLAPEEQGMNPILLQKLDATIKDKFKWIHSFLVVRGGYIVFENYYNFQGCKAGKDDLHNLASVTKGFASTLVGIALKQGYLTSLDENIMDFFPEYDSEKVNAKTRQMTIRHLLNQTAGFGCGMLPEDFFSSKDWNRYTLELPVLHEPGTIFGYEAPSQHIVTAIVSKCSEMDGWDFAKKYLFDPLGITNIKWGRDPQGYLGGSGGASGIDARTRDMAKLGYLYLNNGNWEGKQILTPEYVKEATSVQSAGGPPHGEKYGYMFWVTKYHNHDTYFAGGMGGQFILVIPDLDIVVAITSDWDRHHEENRYLVDSYIIPAIIGE